MRTSTQFEYDGSFASRALGNEWAVVQQAIAGDANALEILLTPHLGKLYHVALAMLGNKEDAEDALQEGLFKACRCLGSFEGRSSFATWLGRIVINSALMTLRHRRTHPESSLDEILDNRAEWPGCAAANHWANPECACALMELGTLIEARIQNLPPSEQTAFRYYAINGHSIMETCLTFDIPPTTFKSRILRTRRKLAKGLRSSLGKASGTSPEGKTVHVSQRR
jgi:RNA polymerase sigma-70 factor (ECF subfamily)